MYVKYLLDLCLGVLFVTKKKQKRLIFEFLFFPFIDHIVQIEKKSNSKYKCENSDDWFSNTISQ